MWVDGSPRVACVTPVRRVAGREVTTLEGLSEEIRNRWANALCASGGSQCGFCTPGIVMRLAGVVQPGIGDEPGFEDTVEKGLLAHLCRCTGWQTVVEAARRVGQGLGPGPEPGSVPGSGPGEPAVGPGSIGASGGSSLDTADRDLVAAEQRATIEGGSAQTVGPHVAIGQAGFADDTSPPGALVAVPDGAGGYVIGASPSEARRKAGKVQGRSTTVPLVHPVPVPDGPWALTLATTWVEPAYLEPDASWCEPGGVPASALANGGAFGGKMTSPVVAEARRLADSEGKTVRVLWAREDVVRWGPKRPPVAGGVRSDGSGRLVVGVTGQGGTAGHGVESAAWEALVDRVAMVAPGIELEVAPVAGPPISLAQRGAVWIEAAVLAAVAEYADRSGPMTGVPVTVTGPSGGRATARLDDDGTVAVAVTAGAVLDAVVLRSYVIGAVHQALGMVTAEGIAVDDSGDPLDLTVRSFGILQARAMPHVEVTLLDEPDRPPVNGSDAVLAAVAAAQWLATGLPPTWPTGRR